MGIRLIFRKGEMPDSILTSLGNVLECKVNVGPAYLCMVGAFISLACATFAQHPFVWNPACSFETE